MLTQTEKVRAEAGAASAQRRGEAAVVLYRTILQDVYTDCGPQLCIRSDASGPQQLGMSISLDESVA